MLVSVASNAKYPFNVTVFLCQSVVTTLFVSQLLTPHVNMRLEQESY